MAGLNCFLGIVCNFLLFTTVFSSKLNVPRVLLPIFSDFQTKFTLEAIEGGCYKWSTTRTDIIKITLIDENKELKCSSKVVVRSITKEEARNLAVVLAQDVHTDQILKCDVIVDVINSLSVTTTTRELFMEEVPEAFQINAYDIQGNEFSTLENVEFEWNILSTGSKDAEVLRYLPFRDSPYETPPHIKKLENGNKMGSVILLEGVKTGTARVSVRLPYSNYKHVPSVEVVLSVIANLLLTPGEIYMMVGDRTIFKLFYMNSGRMDEIRLPDQQYYLTAETDIIHVAKKTNEVSALKLGKTHVLVQNSYAKKDDPAIKLPSAVVNVVEPAYMLLTLQPHRNWAILVGDQHEVAIEIYSDSDHRLHLGPGVQVHTQVGEAFHLEERAKNGTWLSGWGLKESRATVHATLEHVVHPVLGKVKFDPPVQGEAEILIFPRILIVPSEVILPWDPQVKPKYSVDLIAKGGDGRFLWTSTDHSIGLVTQAGIVRTTSYGFFDVSAAMMRNHHNRQIAKFSILPPVRLEIVEYVMEVEVGEAVHLHIALYAEKPGGNNSTFVPVTQCQKLPFQIKTTDNKFIFNKSDTIPPLGIACGNLALVAQEVGETKVTIIYYQDGLMLEDSVTISAHKPLRLFEPSRTVVLAVGSTLHLIYSGGPKPQIGREADHQRAAIAEQEEIIQAEDVTDRHKVIGDDTSVVWVLCRKLGETNVKLLISNMPSLPNCRTKGSHIITKIVCGKPRTINLQPNVNIPDPSLCPMDLSSDRIVLPAFTDIELDVVVNDEQGRTFMNISSLAINWVAKPSGSVKLKAVEGVLPRVLYYGNVPVHNGTFQMITPYQKKGLIEIEVTVMGYNPAILKHFQIKPEWPEFLTADDQIDNVRAIVTSLGLVLVDNAAVSPNYTIIFNQPDIRRTITVLHGSGYVELRLDNDQIAEVRYIEGTHQLEVRPLRPGELTVQLTDLCVASQPTYFRARIVTVKRIDVEMPTRVQINHCLDVIVRLYDQNDDILAVDGIESINLKHKLSTGNANLGIVEKKTAKVPKGELHYILTGLDVGDTVLVFTYEDTPDHVKSKPVEIEVFGPLKLNPRNITLLIGATLQLTVRGGPHDANIEFIPQSSHTECSGTGVVVGKTLGNTKILARAVGIHKKTGNKIVYTEDTVDAHVIKMTGIEIVAPLTRFRVGARVPVWVTGIPDQLTPLVLATFEDSSLEFDWSISETYLATINAVFSPVSISYKWTDRTVIRVTGLQPGRTKLNVNVTVNGERANKPTLKFSSSLELEIYDALELTQPRGTTGKSLLMSRFSTLRLETNLDDMQTVEYSLPGVNNSFLTVDKRGVLKTHGLVGFGTLIITATDEMGTQQRLTYVVEVKPVHYMMLTVIAIWRIHLDSSLRVIPLGTDFDLIPLFFDNLGIQFIAGPPKIKATTNRLDLIGIKHSSTNTTLHISTRKAGHTVIKAWTDGDDTTADYVRVHAEEVIKPVVDSLTYGDIICLYSPVVTKHLQVGHWVSSDPHTLMITSNDVGFVKGRIEADISLTHPLHANVPLTLKVLPLSEITLLYEQPFLTNGEAGSVYEIGVVFKNQINPIEKRHNLIQGWHCDRNFLQEAIPAPFTCYMEFSSSCSAFDVANLFVLQSVFRADIGQYQCNLISTGRNASEASVLATNVTLWVEIEDSPDTISQRLEIEFIPSVYSNEIVIIDDKQAGEFEVRGLNQVLDQIDVQPADSSIVFVDKGKMIESNRKKYTVQLIDYHRKLANSEESMGIIINSPMTNQALTIMVKVSKDFSDDSCNAWRSPLYRFIQQYKYAITVVVSMIVIFIITCYVYSSYMQPVVNVNLHPNRSLLGAGGAMNAMGIEQQSPGGTMSLRTQCGICSGRLSSSPNNTPGCNKNYCTCATRNTPVYGDVSSFNTSPDIRRNRRFL